MSPKHSHSQKLSDNLNSLNDAITAPPNDTLPNPQESEVTPAEHGCDSKAGCAHTVRTAEYRDPVASAKDEGEGEETLGRTLFGENTPAGEFTESDFGTETTLGATKLETLFNKLSGSSLGLSLGFDMLSRANTSAGLRAGYALISEKFVSDTMDLLIPQDAPTLHGRIVPDVQALGLIKVALFGDFIFHSLVQEIKHSPRITEENRAVFTKWLEENHTDYTKAAAQTDEHASELNALYAQEDAEVAARWAANQGKNNNSNGGEASTLGGLS